MGASEAGKTEAMPSAGLPKPVLGCATSGRIALPNRILKESITTSATLALLTAEEERHFYRMIVQADDYGCFDGRPEIIRAKAYPLQLEKVSPQASEGFTVKLVEVGLIHLYAHEEKRYGHFVTWSSHQQIRAKRSKYPLPSCDITCKQVLAHVTVIQSESESESNPKKRSPSQAQGTPLPEWFEPLTKLEGYKAGRHEKARETIEKSCEYRDVDPAKVVLTFCDYWPIGKLKHRNWNAPVQSLCNTIEIQIAKVKGEPMTGGRDGNERFGNSPEKFAEAKRQQQLRASS